MGEVMSAKQIAIGVVLLTLVLGGGCRATAAPPVAVVATATSALTLSPAASDSAPTAATTALSSPAPSPTPAPTVLPTPTPSPPARPLSVHEWDAGPVLFRYDDEVCVDTICVGQVFSPLPTLILYADGRLIARSPWTQPQRQDIEQTQLSPQEVCALLNTFDAIGFLDYDSAAFYEANRAFPRLQPVAELEVNAWAPASFNLGSLHDFLPDGYLKGEVALDRPLLMAYELIERLKLVAGEEAYAPQEMVVGLQRLVAIEPEDQQPGAGGQWLPAVPWVADLQDKARQSEANAPELAAVTAVSGGDATDLLALLNGQLQPRPFGDTLDGELVVVYIRLLLPYESAAGIGDLTARPQIPGPDVATESMRLRCSPEDGLVDFYDELVAATDVRMGLFHPPAQPTVPQPYDRKESDQP